MLFARIKYYIYGVLAAIGAGLLLALKIIAGQRDKARNRADTAERNEAAAGRQREKEHAAAQAQNEARKENHAHAKKEQDRIDSGDRPDRWGDSRLR